MAWTKPIPPATRGRTYFLAVCCVIFAASVASFADTAPRSDGGIVRFLARSRSEVSPKSGRFEVVEKPLEWDAKQTALIICDLWDKHWCDGATQRVGEMAPRIDALAKNLRARGGLIVHAPSDTMAFYKDAPQRKRATEAPLASAPVEFHWNRCDLTVEPPLPIDDSDGGCDCDPPCKTYIAWKREHPAVEVAAEDAVSDQGREIYNLFVQRGIRNVLFCGVHTNMCVLGRSFGIREMRKLGYNVLLVRDLTDTMYNPRSFPYVPHARGTDLVVSHVEKYWCPTVLSSDVLGDPKPLKIVFAIGEEEYHAKDSLPAFAKSELQGKLNATCVFVESDSKTDLPGLEALKDADVLVLFMRRRELPAEQLKAFQTYFDSGKPVVAIRTSCHAFQNWLEFDKAVLGCNYGNHYGIGSDMTVIPAASASDSPLLRGIDAKGWTTASSLYKVLPLADTCAPVLNGSIADKPAEPIAWTNTHRGGRVFFTSLGAPEDFKDARFKRLLLNAVIWAADKSIARP